MLTQLNDPLWTKSCTLGLPYVFYVICIFVIIVISQFGFESSILFLIVPVPFPGRCLPFTDHCLYLQAKRYIVCVIVKDSPLPKGGMCVQFDPRFSPADHYDVNCKARVRVPLRKHSYAICSDF